MQKSKYFCYSYKQINYCHIQLHKRSNSFSYSYKQISYCHYLLRNQTGDLLVLVASWHKCKYNSISVSVKLNYVCFHICNIIVKNRNSEISFILFYGAYDKLTYIQLPNIHIHMDTILHHIIIIASKKHDTILHHAADSCHTKLVIKQSQFHEITKLYYLRQYHFNVKSKSQSM